MPKQKIRENRDAKDRLFAANFWHDRRHPKKQIRDKQ